MFGKRSGRPAKKANPGPAVQAEPEVAGAVEPEDESALTAGQLSAAAEGLAAEPLAEDVEPEARNRTPHLREVETPAPAEKPKQKKPSKLDQQAASQVAPERKTLSEGEAKYLDTKTKVFNALIETVDLSELAKLPPADAREDITDWVNEIVSLQNLVMSAVEQNNLISEICNDILGLGPLEPLLARDDIADLMVNGYDKIYIETEGKIELTPVKFRDNAQLMNICQRIVGAVGRRVDEASPICDARLLDGSRVNVIVPPLAIDGPALTIRKFKKEKLTLDALISFGTISQRGADLLKVISHCRINILVSGGTGSGKTTLLNILTRYIDEGERIITCEDAAELQLQQPHVVRLETRPPNLEGKGEVTMRDLVKNCLRMRPERIIVGEVRGPEAFDLLQAMNTGHDGSMGTIHANNPREACTRVENMIAMGGYNLPQKAVREQISGSINVIVQAARLRDGSRKITHITEMIGMEGEVITMQDLFVFEYQGEDEDGRIIGRHKPTGLRPKFWDRARYFGLEAELSEAFDDQDA